MTSPFRRAAARSQESTNAPETHPRHARRLRAVVLTGCVLGAAALSAVPASAAAVTPAAPSQTNLHIFPSIGSARANPTVCSTSCSLMTFHGGPVQHAEKEYFIFWAPSGYSMPASYRSGLATWLSNVAADDYTPGNVFSVAQQYFDNTSGKTFVPYAITKGSAIVDTSALPASGCTDSDGGVTLPACINDTQIRAEVQKVVTAHNLPQNTNTQYYLFTPKSVGSCFTSASTSCAYTRYCGYHGFFTGTTGQIVYANMPWLYASAGCDANAYFGLGYANASAIDPEVGVLSHEMIETMTDPNLNAWYDSSGNEIGDKCAYMYGAGGYGSPFGLPNNGKGYWNQNLNGGQYMMQQEFSNRDSNGSSTGCVPSDGDTQPIVGISIVPSTPVHGSSAQFTANVTDPAGVHRVSWTFGDGSKGTGSPASHTYASAGAKTLTVIVTDNNGNEAKLTQTVIVS